MDITSNHLDPIMAGWDGGMEGDEGEELSKRIEGFGQPVGKGAGCSATSFKYPHISHAISGDPNIPPVLICKIRKGQELKVKCIVKKVSDSTKARRTYPHQDG